jgi:hypothetical protein
MNRYRIEAAPASVVKEFQWASLPFSNNDLYLCSIEKGALIVREVRAHTADDACTMVRIQFGTTNEQPVILSVECL